MCPHVLCIHTATPVTPAGEQQQINEWKSLISRPFSPNVKTHKSYQLGCIKLDVMST